MWQSITTCGPLSVGLAVSRNKKKLFPFFSYQFKKHQQNMFAMHAGKGLYTLRLEKHGSQYQTYFISLKPALAFQNLTLAMLSKWTRTALGLCCLDRSDFKCRMHEQETTTKNRHLSPFITSVLNSKGNITDTSIPHWISRSITWLFRHFLI